MATPERTVSLYAKGAAQFPICAEASAPDDIANNLSGLIINQNQRSNFVTNPSSVTQEFYLPDDYTRETEVPPLTGFQIYGDFAANATINYRVYRYEDDFAERVVTSTDIKNVSAASGKVTYTTVLPHYLDEGDEITIEGFTGTTAFNGTYLVVSKTENTFTVNSTATGGVTIYGKISRPPRKSVLVGGTYYVKILSLKNKDVHEFSSRAIEINKKRRGIYKQNRIVFNKKLRKIPPGSLLSVKWPSQSTKEHIGEMQNLIDVGGDSWTFPIAKNFFKKIKLTRTKKDSQTNKTIKYFKFVNRTTFISKPYEVRYITKSAQKLFDTKALKYHGGKNIKRWRPVLAIAELKSQIKAQGGSTAASSEAENTLNQIRYEIWAPVKLKKTKIVVPNKNFDRTGSAHYEEPLDIDARYDSPVGWVGVVEGQATANKNGGDQWLSIKFESIDLNEFWVDQKFKIVIEGSGINKLYYCSPSNLYKQANGYLTSTQTTLGNSSSASSMIRVLAGTANETTDFLSNKVRSVATKLSSNNVMDPDYNFWSSKPNPSKYGIENLYFDVSTENDEPVVIDSVFLDAITPGVQFNIYYSTDVNGPGNDNDSWESLLWDYVPSAFKAHSKKSYVLPNPITANYIKIEFTSLQADYYNPGKNDKPILYKKFPSWVINYFLSIYNMNYNKSEDPVLLDQKTIRYDLLDLAFNYYRGDIIDGVKAPIVIEDSNSQNNFVIDLLKNANKEKWTNQKTLEDLDATSLQNINASFDPFRRHPGYGFNTGTVTGKAGSLKSINEYFNYSTERLSIARGKTDVVSTTNRNHLMVEKEMPKMHFYPTCRHGYREAYARFEDNKAYFVKIKEVRFERHNHHVISDKSIYKFTPGDQVNFVKSDFISSKDKWSLT